MKALCEERLVDWHAKFKDIGITCISVTGDSENIEMKRLMCYNVILTTPEKWDCLTRRWKDNTQFVENVKLFMIDEVHLLNEDCRGSTLEAVVSLLCRIRSHSFLQGVCEKYLVYLQKLSLDKKSCLWFYHLVIRIAFKHVTFDLFKQKSHKIIVFCCCCKSVLF